MWQIPSDQAADASAQAGASPARKISSRRSLRLRDVNTSCRKDVSAILITGAPSKKEPLFDASLTMPASYRCEE